MLKQNAKVYLGIFVWLLFPIGIGMLILLFMQGGAWLSAILYPWLSSISIIVFAICIFILLPLAIFKKTRLFSGKSLLLASQLFGLTLWVWSFLLVYILWGIFVLFVGLYIGGIGVVPIAILATLFNGEWLWLLDIVILFFMTYGIRTLAFYVISKSK